MKYIQKELSIKPGRNAGLFFILNDLVTVRLHNERYYCTGSRWQMSLGLRDTINRCITTNYFKQLNKQHMQSEAASNTILLMDSISSGIINLARLHQDGL